MMVCWLAFRVLGQLDECRRLAMLWQQALWPRSFREPGDLQSFAPSVP